VQASLGFLQIKRVWGVFWEKEQGIFKIDPIGAEARIAFAHQLIVRTATARRGTDFNAFRELVQEIFLTRFIWTCLVPNRQSVYLWRNIEACSFNHCWSKKTICSTYSECVFVAVGTRHARRVCYIVICGLLGSTIFFHIIFEKLLNIKCVFWLYL